MPDVQVKDVLSLQVLGGMGVLHKAQGRNTESRTFQQICEVVGIPKTSPCDHSLKGWWGVFLHTLPVNWFAPRNCIKGQHPADSHPFEDLRSSKALPHNFGEKLRTSACLFVEFREKNKGLDHA